MTLEHLHEFHVLTSTMNFSRAAEKLFITQASLSRHIKELEDELGVQLFVRDSHTVTLTNKGLLFSQEAANIYDSYLRILRSATETAAATKRHIRIACATTSFSRRLKTFLHKFELNQQQYILDIDELPDMGLDQFASNYDLLFSPFEYHCPAGMVKQPHIIYEPASLAKNLRGSSSVAIESLEHFENRVLLVPYADEVFCSYNYIKQYLEHLTNNKLRSYPVVNVDSALLYVQQDRGAAIIPRHLSSRPYQDVLFSSVNDNNCRFATYLYAKESLDYEFLQAFNSEIERVLQKEPQRHDNSSDTNSQ